ncbi:MAG: cytochrome c3 family protein, partial [bacterium]
HDPQRQAAIKVIENPPRLERGQPDFVLLSAPPADLKSSKLNTVPFSHINHEKATTTCRGCHHETLARCTDCHTLWGDEKGSEVTLQQAMHNMTSRHSCVGCHNTHKTDIGCAGCHDLMEQARLSEHACNICHAGPPPPKLEKVKSLYTSMDQFQPKPADVKLTFTADEIPDTVTIGVLAKEYPPVKMPHGLITRKLSAYIAASRIATHFHGREDVVCEGCHHHGSIGRQPALCENCHREPFNENDLFRPGLYGAYHQRCIGCHVSMDIQNPSDCKVCHKEGEKTKLGMTPGRSIPWEAGARNSRK